MGIGIIVFGWIIFATIVVVPIIAVRLWFVYRSATKTSQQKKRSVRRSWGVGCASILMIGFWMPIAIIIVSLTDNDESRFEMIFGVEPRENLEFIETDSGYSSDYAGAYVRFQMPIDELQRMLPPTFAPVNPSDLSSGGEWSFSRECLGVRAFQEVPWGQDNPASSYAAVTYCPETQVVVAIAIAID